MFAAALLAAVLVAGDDNRTWTDSTGKFKIQASLIRIENDSAVLKKTDGKEITVPIAKLSKSDQTFLQSQKNSAPDSELIASFEKQANSFRIASDAVLLYTKLSNDTSLANIRSELEAKKKQWESLAAAKSLRMGDKWVSLDDAKKMEEAEQQFLLEAQRLIDVNNWEIASDRLKKASQSNPQSIRADFLTGLILALAMANPEDAQKNFTTCVQRKQKYEAALSDAERRNLMASLNNVAIVRVRQGDYRPAMVAWQQAIELGVPTKELVQNLGKMGALATTHPHLKIPSGIVRESSDLYSKVAVSVGAGKYREDMGWLFMRLVEEPAASQVVGAEPSAPGTELAGTRKSISSQTTGELLLVGGGTGFVLAPGYVITNHHVVDKATKVKIVTPSSGDKQFDAEVVVSASAPDLALLKCPGLELPAIRLRTGAPKLGADVGLVGFPEFTLLGSGLKATRGVISGMADRTTENMLLYDAVTNPGNSGGPVFDKFGQVVAVHSRGLGVAYLGNVNAGKLGAGIPASQLTAFLSARPEVKLATDTGDNAEIPWEDAVEIVGKSTVQILNFQPASTVKFARRESASREVEKWDALEDGWCMTCHGTSAISCPAPGCANGKVRSQGVVTLGKTSNGTAITKRATKFDPCDACNGIGQVKCPHCYHGIEHNVIAR